MLSYATGSTRLTKGLVLALDESRVGEGVRYVSNYIGVCQIGTEANTEVQLSGHTLRFPV